METPATCYLCRKTVASYIAEENNRGELVRVCLDCIEEATECTHEGQNEIDPEDAPAYIALHGGATLCRHCGAWLALQP